jgi:hypothetical protein
LNIKEFIDKFSDKSAVSNKLKLVTAVDNARKTINPDCLPLRKHEITTYLHDMSIFIEAGDVYGKVKLVSVSPRLVSYMRGVMFEVVLESLKLNCSDRFEISGTFDEKGDLIYTDIFESSEISPTPKVLSDIKLRFPMNGKYIIVTLQRRYAKLFMSDLRRYIDNFAEDYILS